MFAKTCFPIATLVTLASALMIAASSPSQQFSPMTSVAISQNQFLLNGQATYRGYISEVRGLLMNARMVNAIFDDENPQTRAAGFELDRNSEENYQLYEAPSELLGGERQE